MSNAKELRAAYQEYRDLIYADYPQVKEFEERKRKWLKFLLLYTILLNLAKAITYYSYSNTGEKTGLSLILLLVGLLVGISPTLIFLLAAMTPKWKIALVLYFPPFQFLVQIVQTLMRRGMREIPMFFQAYTTGFAQHPFIVSLDVLSWLLILLIFGTAIWLTVIPKNRKLADQSEKLTDQWKKYILSHPVQ